MSTEKKIEPTPYPIRPMPNIVPQKPINATDSKTQLYFLKNELFSLENKYDNLMKLFSKSEKKVKEQAEELKKLKNSNDNLIKEENINKKIIKKITEEKNNLMKIISENKKYISNIEKKLISGVKNEFLVEQNKTLKDKIDSLEIENKKLKDKEEYFNNEKTNIENQAKIIQKALQIKSEEIKNYFKNDENEKNEKNINEQVIFDISKQLKEKEDLKLLNTNLENINKENSMKINSYKEKIQELNFAKSTLTKMLAEKEGEINNLLKEKNDFIEQINSLKENNILLNNHIKELELDIKTKEENEKKRIEEEKILTDEKNKIKDYKVKIQVLEYANKDLSQKLLNSENQISILEKSLEKISQKNSKIEKLYKEHITQNNIFLNEVTTLKIESEKLNCEYNKSKIDNDKNINIINELNNKLHEYEKENLKLISKLNNQIFEKDYIENNLVKQNNKILIHSQEQDERIKKILEENNILSEEKDKYKKLYEQIYNHTNNISREKNISLIRQQIKYMKNINNSMNTQNNTNTYDNSKYIFYLENEKNETKNGGRAPPEKKTIADNTNDNTRDINNRSLTPIRVDHFNNNSFITSFNDDNNLEQNNKSLFLLNNTSTRKKDKILEMIRKEKSKKKLLETDLKKIEG